jgi:2'-5' RNA ligase
MQLSFPLSSAFLALPLDGTALEEFQRLQAPLEQYSDILKLQSPVTPHLTLYFWKSLMEIEYDQLLKQASSIATATQPFELQINGVDTFGHQGNDHVLFFTVAFSDELGRLKKRCPWPNIAREPTAVPSHEFHPHITIAHIKHPGKFQIHKKKILKLLSDVSINMTCSYLRLYAEVNEQKQTPLKDFRFEK